MPTITLQDGLGRAVRRLREDARFGQEHFADVVGLHRTAMSALERGLKDVKLSTLIRLSDGLQCSVSELLQEAEREIETAGQATMPTDPPTDTA